jgi:hypothetical protein
MTYFDHLNALRALPKQELMRYKADLIKDLPKRLHPWPRWMPASLDPKLILVGVSPGNSPAANDLSIADNYTSIPTVNISAKSHYYCPDGRRYWDKIRYLAHKFFLREGTVTTEQDALSLCSHYNLGVGMAGKASENAVERDVIAWVSRLLNKVQKPDLIVLFGLRGILSSSQASTWWNCAGGLPVNWTTWQAEKNLKGYSYKFREWTVINARNDKIKIVMWPNHPSRHPFADINVWKRSVNQYFGLA